MGIEVGERQFFAVDDALAGWVAENDGVGLEHAGDVGGGDFVEAGVQVQIDRGASHCEILVVNGEGYRLVGILLRCCKRHGKGCRYKKTFEPHNTPPGMTMCSVRQMEL